MSDKQKDIQKVMEESLSGALDLMLPKDRPDLQQFVQWLMNVFVDPVPAKQWNGYYFMPGFEVDTAKYAYDEFVPKAGDVLVASYPKTGTNWLAEITRNILFVKDVDMLTKVKKMSPVFVGLEFGPVSKYQVVNNLQLPRRLLVTHMSASLVNLKKFQDNGAKVLYVIRNPKDQAVSWYHFATKFPFAKTEHWRKVLPENEREFYDLYLTGKQNVFAKEGEGYLEHVKEWYEHRNDSNVMFVVYEEMKEDAGREIRKISQFLGMDLSDAEVGQVVERTTFNNMKKENAEKKSVVPQICRKGQVGDWKNHLTVAQSELIDASVEKVLGDTDIKFIYELDNQ